MRKAFSDLVEAGRVRTGRAATLHGERQGAFRLKRLPMQKEFFVFASDGSDWAALFAPPAWEHVSVSLPDRCPAWEEMCWIKDLFFEPEECVIQFHPPASQYVNNHRYCLHLWRVLGADFPLPPPGTVGVKDAGVLR